MSGGHIDNIWSISQVYEQIQNEIDRDFTYESEDYSKSVYNKRDFVTYDMLSDATPEQREEIVNYAKECVKLLKRGYEIAHELDYLLSSDTSSKTFLERIKDLK